MFTMRTLFISQLPVITSLVSQCDAFCPAPRLPVSRVPYVAKAGAFCHALRNRASSSREFPHELHMGENSDNLDPSQSTLLVGAGLFAQTVVWTSLYFVVTTGGGLPPGPFGLLGGLEGVAYLTIVGIVCASLYRKVVTGSGLAAGPNGLLGAAEGLSYLSLLAGLLALVILSAEQGCVPNAKPILDYSAYLPVCDPQTGTPGLFGR